MKIEGERPGGIAAHWFDGRNGMRVSSSSSCFRSLMPTRLNFITYIGMMTRDFFRDASTLRCRAESRSGRLHSPTRIRAYFPRLCTTITHLPENSYQ
jgi:hypothetical protein